jgi:hypothetical protein
LKAEPNAANYSSLLFHTFDLIEILLQTDKPQLAIDVVIRVWQDFANESSLHRKICLVKLGRVLTPEQGREMMRGFTRYVCEALQAQQQQPAKEEKKEKKAFIKVTTAKMLAEWRRCRRCSIPLTTLIFGERSPRRFWSLSTLAMIATLSHTESLPR